MSPNVSVIVPSYNGRKKLPSILKALAYQTISGFEVIVVLDGSTDGSKAFLKNYQTETFKLRVIERENGGRAKVRNTGAAEAISELLVFYDDDMRLEPNSIALHIAFHETHKGGICGGNQIENLQEAITDFDRYRCYIRKKWNNSFKKLTKLNRYNLHLTAANFSISKKCFLKAGLFDDILTDAEDIEFAYRAIEEDIDVYFDPENIAWHNDFVGSRKYIQRRREYNAAYKQLIKSKINKEWKEKHKLKKSQIKMLIFSFFSTIYWVRLIESESLLFVPKIIRYKIYDIIITGLGSVFTNRPLQ